MPLGFILFVVFGMGGMVYSQCARNAAMAKAQVPSRVSCRLESLLLRCRAQPSGDGVGTMRTWRRDRRRYTVASRLHHGDLSGSVRRCLFLLVCRPVGSTRPFIHSSVRSFVARTRWFRKRRSSARPTARWPVHSEPWGVFGSFCLPLCRPGRDLWRNRQPDLSLPHAVLIDRNGT